MNSVPTAACSLAAPVFILREARRGRARRVANTSRKQAEAQGSSRCGGLPHGPFASVPNRTLWTVGEGRQSIGKGQASIGKKPGEYSGHKLFHLAFSLGLC